MHRCQEACETKVDLTGDQGRQLSGQVVSEKANGCFGSISPKKRHLKPHAAGAAV